MEGTRFAPQNIKPDANDGLLTQLEKVRTFKFAKFLRDVEQELGPKVRDVCISVWNETGAKDALTNDLVINNPEFWSYMKNINDPEIIGLHLRFIAENPDAIGALTDPGLLASWEFIKRMKIKGYTTIKPTIMTITTFSPGISRPVEDPKLEALKRYFAAVAKTGRVDLLTSQDFKDSLLFMGYDLRSIILEKISENPSAASFLLDSRVFQEENVRVWNNLHGIWGDAFISEYLDILIKTRELKILTSKHFKHLVYNIGWIEDSTGEVVHYGPWRFLDVINEHPKVLRKLFTDPDFANSKEFAELFDSIEDSIVQEELLSRIREMMSKFFANKNNRNLFADVKAEDEKEEREKGSTAGKGVEGSASEKDREGLYHRLSNWISGIISRI